jgi:hypothetical protein
MKVITGEVTGNKGAAEAGNEATAKKEMINE